MPDEEKVILTSEMEEELSSGREYGEGEKDELFKISE